uniref:Katanin p60 ATPase-containing subunit A-like 2 n=1 Tax=Tetradesmus obliquus TaxID=3088 RepID=A0A383VC06_TETOB|eukprot:jgi/Sobl393_1/6604/SZX61886.1
MDSLLVKAAAKGREAQARQEQERRRALIVLVLRHLLDQGYIEAHERLSAESNVSLTKVDAADNIDLLCILQEFEDGYEAKYGRRPKLVRRVSSEEAGLGVARPGCRRQTSLSQHHDSTAAGGSNAPTIPAPISGQLAARQRREKGAAAATAAAATSSPAAYQRGASFNSSKQQQQQQQQQQQKAADPASSSSTADVPQQSGITAAPLIQISGQSCTTVQPAAAGSKQRGSGGPGSSDGSDDEDFHATRLLKPLPTSLLGDLRELGSAISRDIYLDSPNVHWGDIAGLDEAKRLLKESVVLPLKYPQLFTGLLAPWRGLLLYGPPGTGKTLLAKAVATQCRTTFFNISASSIISKWRGDSEKLVRVLFDLARHHAPSTIFLDEIDALMGARGAEGEHEASRRMKTELLIQMDGLMGKKQQGGKPGSSSSSSAEEPQVFVLAATNMPWELDMALLRRLEKRILVPLPGLQARRAMLGALLGQRIAAEVDLDGLAAATAGYSGSDVTVVAKEAAMRPLRRLMAVLEPSVYTSAEGQSSSSSSKVSSTTSKGAAAGSSEATAMELGPVTAEDVAAALAATKPSAQAYEAHYEEFSMKYGQVV